MRIFYNEMMVDLWMKTPIQEEKGMIPLLALLDAVFLGSRVPGHFANTSKFSMCYNCTHDTWISEKDLEFNLCCVGGVAIHKVAIAATVATAFEKDNNSSDSFLCKEI